MGKFGRSYPAPYDLIEYASECDLSESSLDLIARKCVRSHTAPWETRLIRHEFSWSPRWPQWGRLWESRGRRDELMNTHFVTCLYIWIAAWECQATEVNHWVPRCYNWSDRTCPKLHFEWNAGKLHNSAIMGMLHFRLTLPCGTASPVYWRVLPRLGVIFNVSK